MLDTILCVSDEEPAAFHPVDERGFSVRLSYRVDDGSEDDARDAYTAWLESLATVSFAVYEVAGLTLTRRDDPALLAEPFDPACSAAFVAWLKARASTHQERQGAHAGFFVHAPSALGAAVVKSEATLSAADVMLAAASWIAPVPQRLHLAFVLRVRGAAADAKLVFAPYPAGAVPPDLYVLAAEPVPGQMIELPAYLGSARACETSVTKPLGTAPGAQSTTIDYASGFANAGQGSEEGYRILKRVEQRAGSLLSALFAVRELSSHLRWPVQAMAAQQAAAPSLPVRQAIQVLAWSAVTALAASLDTLLLALLMPARALRPGAVPMPMLGQRDGALLAPLIDMLIDALERLLGDQVQAALPVRERRRRVREAVRHAISALFALAPPGGDDANAVAARQALVELLAHVCQIDYQASAAGTPDQQWRNVLLAYYIERSAHNYTLIDTIVRSMDAGAADNALAGTPARLLDLGLSSLQDSVTSEAGTEATLERILDLAGAGFVTALGLDPATFPDIANNAWAAARAAFTRSLASDINAAEAARHAAGSLFADLLVQDGPDPEQRGTAPQLARAFDDSLFWHRRLGMRPAAGPAPDNLGMAALLSVLPRPVDQFDSYIEALTEADKLALNLADVAALMQASAKPELFPPAATRFLPDHAPQPLPVRLSIDPAADDDDDDVDDFAAVFAGVSLLVRRTGAFAANELWAYANLAEVQYPTAPGLAEHHAWSIQPIPTTVVDGRRTLFVTYDGLPIATSAFDTTLSAPAASVWSKFTATDYPPDHPGFAPLAPLAYGARFDVAAHAVGRSSTLPLALQEARFPWRPLALIAIDEDRASRQYLTSYGYSRRTAIGRTAITPLRAAGAAGTALPDGLKPLAADYPRLGLSRHHGQFLDIFRNNDGSGAIGLPQLQGATVRMTVRELWLWAPAGATVKVRMTCLTAADSAADSAAEAIDVELAPGELGNAELAITCVTAPSPGALGSYTVGIALAGQAPPPIALAGSASAWLRLRVASPGAPASLSFADPSADSPGAAAASRPVPDSLLLLGEQGPLWHDQFSRPLNAVVPYPRVGYLDFARWVANPLLRKEVFGDSILANRFLELVLAAYIGRTEDAELARLLERLPDPAVSALRFELLATDCLLDAVDNVTTDGDLLAAPLQLPLASLASLLAGPDYASWLAGGQIKAVLYKLDQQLSFQITVKARTGALQLAGARDLVPHVPPGVVARLSARPVVRRALFASSGGGKDIPSVIDPRLLQWAVGFDADDTHVMFDGDSIQIEAMLGALSHEPKDAKGWRLSREQWIAQKDDNIVHVAAGLAREYRLMAQPQAGSWQWRQLSAVDVSSQRWRFSGRPIYTWIDPRQAARYRDAVVKQASIELDGSYPDLADFEAEAFFGRMDYDAEIESALLRPLAARTEVLHVRWEQAAATMFRHRFTLRSRYAAAMRESRNGACDAWPVAAPGAQAGWLRVVLLADRSHLTLTRPQLRALVPATCAPDDEDATNPPLIGLLQEHPFCNGGLAARIAAEIRTGVGFEFDKVTAPLDARKELGPDPRLSYFGMREADARNMVLAAEGPIGLTFDAAKTAAAAFSSTALLLAPRCLRAGAASAAGAGPDLGSAGLAEHFMSVVLRRYLDHRWLVDTGEALHVAAKETTKAPFGATWWIEFPARDGQLSVTRKDGARAMAVARCAIDSVDGGAKSLQVTVDRYAIDASVAARAVADTGDPAAPEHDAKPLYLCAIPNLLPDSPPGAGSIIFLHTPVDPRHAILSVFFAGASTETAKTGAGNAPTLVASIEWSVPDGFDAIDIGIDGAGHAAYPVNASASSALQWARTNTNFDTVCAIAPGQVDQGIPVGVSELSVMRRDAATSSHLWFERDHASSWWLRALQSTKPFPVHAQRHMAILPSQLRSGIGKAIDVPFPAQMAPGREIVIAQRQDIDLVRIIEFETPAIILGYQAPGGATVPEHYRTGYIDLQATGFDRMASDVAPQGWQLSLHLRVIGGQQCLKSLTSLQLELRSQANGAGWVGLPMGREHGTAALAFVCNVPVAMTGLAKHYSSCNIDAEGAVSLAVPTKFVKPEDGSVLPDWKIVNLSSASQDSSQGLELRIGKVSFEGGHASDLWLELSLLASVARQGEITPSFVDGVDFDWFFGGPALQPDQAILHEELARMRECQARIISVSQPISVTLLP